MRLGAFFQIEMINSPTENEFLVLIYRLPLAHAYYRNE